MTKSKVVVQDDEISDVVPMIRGPFSRFRVRFNCVGESMTHQSHAESCDINRIIDRYDRTGQLPTGRVQGVYDDVTSLQVDLTDAVNRSREVRSETDKFVKSRKAKADKEQLDLVAEVEALRASKSRSPATDGGLPPSGDGGPASPA